MFQFALPNELLPFKLDKPALPVPLFRLPNASQKAETLAHALCIPMLVFSCKDYEGEAPLYGYAVNSPLLPLGERRAAKDQYAKPNE